MTPRRLAVWLYGSHARGNWDRQSDVDVLVVGSPGTNVGEVQSLIPTSLRPASFSQYSWEEISGMASYGSLFLQHLRLEAYPLFESPSCQGTLASILLDLGRYEYVDRDIAAFRVVIEDVSYALREKETEIYELSTLATVMRHCSILGCWLQETPHFGRTVPVDTFVTTLGQDPSTAIEFPDLYKYRLYIDGRLGRGTYLPFCRRPGTKEHSC